MCSGLYWKHSNPDLSHEPEQNGIPAFSRSTWTSDAKNEPVTPCKRTGQRDVGIPAPPSSKRKRSAGSDSTLSTRSKRRDVTTQPGRPTKRAKPSMSGNNDDDEEYVKPTEELSPAEFDKGATLWTSEAVDLMKAMKKEGQSVQSIRKALKDRLGVDKTGNAVTKKLGRLQESSIEWDEDAENKLIAYINNPKNKFNCLADNYHNTLNEDEKKKLTRGIIVTKIKCLGRDGKVKL